MGMTAGLACSINSPLHAQMTGRVWRVGILANAVTPGTEALLDSMRKGLARLGYVEGQNIAYEFRHAGGQLERMASLATDLASSNVDIIVTSGGPASSAASTATSRIPVIFSIVADPVAIKLVDSMQRPGGNVTGITNHDPAQATQQFSLLKEALPQLARVAILGEDGLPGADGSGMVPLERDYFSAARALGLQPQLIRIKGPTPDLEEVLAAASRERADALILLEVPLAFRYGKQIAEVATARRLPTLFPSSLSDSGATISYSTSVLENWTRVPAMIDRIVKGTPVGEIPVEVNSGRVLVVNARTARQVGMAVPDAILKRADRVID
jgi:putative ABC transport system substrate-binding protein